MEAKAKPFDLAILFLDVKEPEMYEYAHKRHVQGYAYSKTGNNPKDPSRRIDQ